MALTFSLVAWDSDLENDALKRVFQSSTQFNLPVDIRLTNITMLYLSVKAIERVQDPQSSLSAAQLNATLNYCDLIGIGDKDKGGLGCGLSFGNSSFALISDKSSTTISASPSLVSTKNLLILNTGSANNGTCDEQVMGFHGSLAHPSNSRTYRQPADGTCWKFAWVTYAAGSGTCENCHLSSRNMVQNDTTIVPQAGAFTDLSLALTPFAIDITLTAGSQNIGPVWNTTDDHVIGHLTRSYASTWMTLNYVSGEASVSTTYSLSPPSSKAFVDLLRVYIWLGFQLLLTISGILFVFLQLRSNSPLVSDTTLAPFLLDTSAVKGTEEIEELRGAQRRVEYEGDRLMVKLF